MLGVLLIELKKNELMNYSDGARQKLSDGIWLHFTFTK